MKTEAVQCQIYFFSQFPTQSIPIKSRNVVANEKFAQGKWQK